MLYDSFSKVNGNCVNVGGKFMNKFKNLFLHVDMIDRCGETMSEDMGIGDVVLTLKNTGWADVLLYGHRDVLEITASILKLVALLQKVTGFEYGIVVRNVVWNKVEIEGNLSVKSIDYVLNASVYE